MADTERKGKAGKGAKADKPAQKPKQDSKQNKPQAAQQGKPEKVKPGKAEAAERSAKSDAAAKEAGQPPAVYERVTPRLKTHFEEVVRTRLAEQFGYKNRLQVPVIEKVVINMGIGEGVADRRKVETAANDLGLIAGRRRSSPRRENP